VLLTFNKKNCSKKVATKICRTTCTPWGIVIKETLLSLTSRVMRLEVSQGHQTCYHSIW